MAEFEVHTVRRHITDMNKPGLRIAGFLSNQILKLIAAILVLQVQCPLRG